MKRELDDDVIDIESQKRKRFSTKEHVDQDIVDSLVKKGDLRKKLCLKNDIELEVKWYIEYDTCSEEDENESGEYWCSCKIVDCDTKKTHRFYENNMGLGDHQDVPIVKIVYHDEDDPGVKEVCFLTDHIIYDIEHDSMLAWRKLGEDFEESFDEESDSGDEVDPGTIEFSFEDKGDIRIAVEQIIANIFTDILAKHATMFNNLPFKQQQDWTAVIVVFKNKLVDKIVDFFEKSITEDRNSVVLSSEIVNKLIDSTMEELDTI